MPHKKWALCLAVICAGFIVSACDEAEQDRVLRYEKGTYLGPVESPLDTEQLNELRQRAKRQGAN
jgi:hypothetical protein